MVQRTLFSGSRIEPLVNGVEVFPAMLEVIENLRASIALTKGQKFSDWLKIVEQGLC